MADSQTLLFVAVAIAGLTACLQAVVLLRKPRFETPADLDARLRLLEQNVQAAVQANARLEGASQGLERRLQSFTEETGAGFAASRRAWDEQLAQTLDEARNGRAELGAALQAFEARLASRQAAGEAALAQRLGAFRDELSALLRTLADETARSRQALADTAAASELRAQDRFEALTQAACATLAQLKADVEAQLRAMSSALKDQLDANGSQLRHQFSSLQESMAGQLHAMAAAGSQASDQLRVTLNERLAAIQNDNGRKLEEMRRTVDEKLHATLEQRLGDSFKLVSERLEQVHAGLGEMKTLAGSVGDLKRVMSNVRARGTWGEVQLGAIIESLFTADQFQRNVKTVPGSNDLVEYAVRMPGKTDDAPVWLPIDCKYPVEHYQRLLDAHEQMDKVALQQAVAAFETSIRAEAKKISSKYLSPPHTTDFAILFVPTEGLFAEIMRIAGLAEALQNDHRVVVAGPTTLAALLNSLRLGFRTLAIEKRSSEVWAILGSVKTEFRKFGEIVESTKKSIAAAAHKFDELGRRTRAISRGLSDVQELPAAAAAVVSLPSVSLVPGGDEQDVDEPALSTA